MSKNVTIGDLVHSIRLYKEIPEEEKIFFSYDEKKRKKNNGRLSYFYRQEKKKKKKKKSDCSRRFIHWLRYLLMELRTCVDKNSSHKTL